MKLVVERLFYQKCIVLYCIVLYYYIVGNPYPLILLLKCSIVVAHVQCTPGLGFL